MQLESSQNYYYRYKVLSASDLHTDTLNRRLTKIKQAHANSVLVDITELQDQIDQIEWQNLNARLIDLNIEYLISKSDFILNFEFYFKFLKPEKIHVQLSNLQDFRTLNLKTDLKITSRLNIQIAPRTGADLQSLASERLELINTYRTYSWDFRPFNIKLKNSLSVQQIGNFFRSKKNLNIEKCFSYGKLNGLEIWNESIPTNHELESESVPAWEFQIPNSEIQLSIIIPSFNNAKFLSNVIHHLNLQDIAKTSFEIIVVEDGGKDKSCEIIYSLFKQFQNSLNLKFIYWDKENKTRGPQNFFRAGLARNLGAQFAKGKKLFFLDSDMLVPSNFVSIVVAELKYNDVVQFQRHHIHQNNSLLNPSYDQVKIASDTYIEEQAYWNQLFTSNNWGEIPNFWKFTCTYALGLDKSDFISVGRFKKYYVSYGFEDTDLGYELARRGKKFKLIQIPLLHLTAYDQMQYRNSQLKRTQLLRKTSKLFYLQHLDDKIFDVLQGYYRFEKPILSYLKDLF